MMHVNNESNKCLSNSIEDQCQPNTDKQQYQWKETSPNSGRYTNNKPNTNNAFCLIGCLPGNSELSSVSNYNDKCSISNGHDSQSSNRNHDANDSSSHNRRGIQLVAESSIHDPRGNGQTMHELHEHSSIHDNNSDNSLHAQSSNDKHILTWLIA